LIPRRFNSAPRASLNEDVVNALSPERFFRANSAFSSRRYRCHRADGNSGNSGCARNRLPAPTARISVSFTFTLWKFGISIGSRDEGNASREKWRKKKRSAMRTQMRTLVTANPANGCGNETGAMRDKILEITGKSFGTHWLERGGRKGGARAPIANIGRLVISRGHFYGRVIRRVIGALGAQYSISGMEHRRRGLQVISSDFNFNFNPLKPIPPVLHYSLFRGSPDRDVIIRYC